MSVAPNTIANKRWRDLLTREMDPSDPSDPNPKALLVVIASTDTTVSDDHVDGEWVLNGKLRNGRFISIRASEAGIHAMSISYLEAAVINDLQRFQVAARVGLVQVPGVRPGKKWQGVN